MTDNIIVWDAVGPHLEQWDLSRGRVTGIGVAPKSSPDGRWVAYRTEARILPQIFVVPIEGGSSRQLGPGTEYSWAPTSTWLAIEQPPWIDLRSVSDVNLEHRLSQGVRPDWSPGDLE